MTLAQSRLLDQIESYAYGIFAGRKRRLWTYRATVSLYDQSNGHRIHLFTFSQLRMICPCELGQQDRGLLFALLGHGVYSTSIRDTLNSYPLLIGACGANQVGQLLLAGIKCAMFGKLFNNLWQFCKAPFDFPCMLLPAGLYIITCSFSFLFKYVCYDYNLSRIVHNFAIELELV